MSHLNNPASVTVNILENERKVIPMLGNTCILRGVLSCCSLVSLRAELGPNIPVLFYSASYTPFPGDRQLLHDHEKIDFNFSEH